MFTFAVVVYVDVAAVVSIIAPDVVAVTVAVVVIVVVVVVIVVVLSD